MKRFVAFVFTMLLVSTGCNTGSSSGGDTSADAYRVGTEIRTGGGQISPQQVQVKAGESTTFTLTPDSGYRLAAIEGCEGTRSGNVYTTGLIARACTVSARFEPEYSPISCMDQAPLPGDGKFQISRTPTFQWGSCSSAEGDPVVYDLYLCEEDPNIPLRCIIRSPLENYEKVASDLTQTTWTPASPLKENASYFWFLGVRAGAHELKRATGSHQDALWRFNTIRPGGLLWSYPLKERPLRQTAISPEGLLFAGYKANGRVAAIAIADGKEKWEFDLHTRNITLEDPLVDMDHIAVLPDGSVLTQHFSGADASTRGWLGALQASDGAVIWEHSVFCQHRSAASILPDGRVAFIARRGRIQDDPQLVVLAQGVEEWAYDGAPQDSRTGFYPGDDLSHITASPGGGVYGFTFPRTGSDSSEKMDMKLIREGAMVWSNRYAGNDYDHPQFVSRWRASDGFQTQIAYDLAGDLYIVGGARLTPPYGDREIAQGYQRLHKISRHDGAVLWSWSPGIPYARFATEGVVIREQTLYLVVETTLFAIDTATGKTLWQKTLPVGVPGKEGENFLASIALLSGNRLLVVFSAFDGIHEINKKSNAWIFDEQDRSIQWQYYPTIEPRDSEAVFLWGDCLNLTAGGVAVFCSRRYSDLDTTLDAVDLRSYGGLDPRAAWPILGQNPQRTFSRMTNP